MNQNTIDRNFPKSVGGSTKYRFKVDFNTVHNEDVESIIEKFNEVFVFHSVTEVGKN